MVNKDEIESFYTILKAQGKKIGENYYWKNIFPEVKKEAKEKAKELSGKYDGLMITVGEHPQPIILCIDSLKPKEVYLLYSDKTKEQLKKIKEECKTKFAEDEVIWDNSMNTYKKIRNKYDEWIKRGVKD